MTTNEILSIIQKNMEVALKEFENGKTKVQVSIKFDNYESVKNFNNIIEKLIEYENKKSS